MLARPQAVSPSHCAQYYTHEDSVEVPGYWWGSGASDLGLKGEIQPRDLQRVSNGVKPTSYSLKNLDENSRLRKTRNVQGQMVKAAYDLVYAPSKGVSYEVLVVGNVNLMLAHNQAVEHCLKLDEQEYSYSRMIVDDKRKWVLTGNILTAVFQHSSNRNNDPHLHTHCLRMNTHLCPDGHWRSSETKPLFRARRILSYAYQEQMSQSLEEQNYKLCWSEQGNVDIATVPNRIIFEFSTRRREVLSKAKSDSSGAKKLATLQTRRQKVHKDWEDLRMDWKLRSENHVKPIRRRGIAL